MLLAGESFDDLAGDSEDELELSDDPEDDDEDDDEDVEAPDAAEVPPLARLFFDRESVMYQPLPLNTMPTGWITLRSAPPHCSQVVSGGSEKLWRFSITSLQAVQV